MRWYESFFQPTKTKGADRRLDEATALLLQSRDAGNVREEIRALKALGLIHLTQTHLHDVATDFLLKALALEDSLGLKDQQVFTYMAMARVFEDVSDYNKSEEFLQEALRVNEQYKNYGRLVRILNETGKINAARGRIDAAFENYELMLQYKDVVDDPAVEAQALYQIAHLYTQQGQYQKALDNHKQSLAIYRSIRNKKEEALVLNDIGELYSFMKNEVKAMDNHQVSLKIRQALSDKKGMAESFNNIGELLFAQKEIARAVLNLELGLKAAREAQDQNQIRKSADYLYQCYLSTGDYKKALEYETLVVGITDFMLHDKNEQDVLQRQSRYALEKKELQIDKLKSEQTIREKEIAEQIRFRNFLFIIIGLGSIIVLLIFYLYLSKQRTNKVLQVANATVQAQNTSLQELNATKDKFFSIISHDLKGPLNSLTSFSSLLINHSESLSKEEIKMLAGDLDKSLKNLFALLENLLEWSRSQTGNMEFKPEDFNLTEVLESNRELLKLQAGNKNITVVNNVNQPVPVQANKNSINTVVRNLISNAIKFTPEGGAITLDKKVQGGEVIVSIADNGVGMSPEVLQKLFRIDTKHSTKGTAQEKGTGLGLILCKEFIEKNGGRIWVESEIGKGSVFYFTLKKL